MQSTLLFINDCMREIEIPAFPCICIKIYINTYLCMRLHVFLCFCMRMYICTYIYICFSFVHVCMNECVCTYVYICMFVRAYECIFICMLLHVVPYHSIC